MKRYITPDLHSDLKNKMVFLGGPRQVGKTTIALDLLKGDENHPGYFNWDYASDKKLLLQGGLPANQNLVVLDEFHKYKQWRNFVKGLYDKNKSRVSFLVTGSARLEYYRRGGDSLQGRYQYHRLHPLSLLELNATPTATDLEVLLKYGGFPDQRIRVLPFTRFAAEVLGI